MHVPGKKAQAESILLEVPSVLAAYVREDVHGNPREIHLLVSPGRDVRQLAREACAVLKSRLGIEIDQRIISIAQLSEHVTDWSRPAESGAGESGRDNSPIARHGSDPAIEVPTPASDGAVPQRGGAPAMLPGEPRLVYSGVEVRFGNGRAEARVRLAVDEEVFDGEAHDVDTQSGRIRAAASATLAAAADACRGSMEFHLEGASLVRVFDRDMVIVSAVAFSPLVGRKPLPLVGAQPVDIDVEEAATFASLKAIARVVTLGLKGARR